MEDFERATDGLQTKSDKIRALAKAGYSRAEIASLLEIRYQHVRSVLIGSGMEDFGRQDTGHKRSSIRRMSKREWKGSSLVESGFEKLGEWQADGDRFSLSATAPTGAGVYSFVVDGIVKYVGVTQGALRTRLSHYVYGHRDQKTSARLNRLIVDALANGCRIEVLIAQPEPLNWNGLPVDCIAGLECGLIREIHPEWNLQGKH